MSNLSKSFDGPNIRPVRDLRNNYTEIAKIIQNHEPVFITNNGRGEAVLLNIEDYTGYEEYLYNNYVAEKLAEAEAEAAKPDAKWHSLEDVDTTMRNKLHEA